MLDELAAGFAAALRDRVHGEHQDLLRTRLAQASTQDVLTRLPNRAVIEQWVHRAFAGITGSGDEPVHVGLCALDLDGFAALNERWGRDVGDWLLVAVAARLRQVVAPHLLARTGGDEFAVSPRRPGRPRCGPRARRPGLRRAARPVPGRRAVGDALGRGRRRRRRPRGRPAPPD